MGQLWCLYYNKIIDVYSRYENTLFCQIYLQIMKVSLEKLMKVNFIHKNFNISNNTITVRTSTLYILINPFYVHKINNLPGIYWRRLHIRSWSIPIHASLTFYACILFYIYWIHFLYGLGLHFSDFQMILRSEDLEGLSRTGIFRLSSIISEILLPINGFPIIHQRSVFQYFLRNIREKLLFKYYTIPLWVHSSVHVANHQ